MNLPVITEEHANCSECELQPQLDKGLRCYAYAPPERFNGIMIVGEGPGHQEVARGRPFIGQSGRILRWMLDCAGLDVDECYITNATLCKPPPKDQSLHEAFPNAIPSCLSRLEAEIALVRPRVIVGLGAAALVALTGYDQKYTKQIPNIDCRECENLRKVGPVLECSAPIRQADGSASPCKYLHYFAEAGDDAKTPKGVDPRILEKLRAAGCQNCGARLTRQRPKMIKCPACGGRKTQVVELSRFIHDYSVSEAAGALFDVPKDKPTKPYELDPWLREQGVRYVITTWHPAFLLRGQQFAAEACIKHFAKAKQLLDKPAESWPVNHEITDDPAVVREYCAETGVVYACDIETEAWSKDDDGNPVQLDARKVYNVTNIRCLGIHREGARYSLVVDTREASDELLDELDRFLCNHNKPKCWQNGGCYDLPVIARMWDVPIREQITSLADDTLTAHHALYPDESKDLGHMGFKYTHIRPWKESKRREGRFMRGSFEDLALYNAKDVQITGRVMRTLRHELRSEGLENVYNMDMKLLRIGADMHERGMALDVDAFREAGRTLRKRIDGIVDNARELLRKHTRLDPEIKEAFDPNKTANHLIPALFDREGFNLPPLAVTKKTKAPVTDANVLRNLLGNVPPEASAFVKCILDYREHAKIRGTYIESPHMQPWEDGRIHPLWMPHGTRTGRYSSSPNAQNWPQWLRVFVQVVRGRRIVGADYSQLELRGIGSLSGDKRLIQLCMNADESRKLEPDHDPHSFIAGIAFDKRYTQLALEDPNHVKQAADDVNSCKCETCRRKALRDLVKRVIYGMNYGAGDAKIVEAVYSGGYDGPPVTVPMISRIRKTIYREFSGIAEWREDQVRRAHETHELRSPILGRRRVFPLGEIPVTEIYNYPIQSLGADIINRATIKLFDEVAAVDPTAFLFAQGHDSLYFECDEDRAPDVAKLVGDTMSCEEVLVPGAPAMSFPATAVIADNWRDA